MLGGGYLEARARTTSFKSPCKHVGGAREGSHMYIHTTRNTVTLCAILAYTLFCLACLFACGEQKSVERAMEMESTHITQNGSSACSADHFRHPTTPLEFERIYQNRGFYTDYNHLGRDTEHTEGTTIYPVACGTVVGYRSASGYGRLVAVIEHRLPFPVEVTNGIGRKVTIDAFLSIYGHLRSTLGRSGNGSISDLHYEVGDPVTTDSQIGYVDADALNGDGGEHLHLGIRLQSLDAAIATDPYYFRGYDDAGSSQRRYFADPKLFLETLMMSGLTVRWHPPGTVITHATTGERYRVGEGSLLRYAPDDVEADRLGNHEIPVSDAEMHCLGPVIGDAGRELDGHRLVRFPDHPVVYEFTGLNPGALRWSFVNEHAFFSWGWSFDEVQVWDSFLRASFLGLTTDRGFRILRDSSLVKARGESEVSVVSEGKRLPIFDWPTFLALGYKPERIIEVDPEIIEATSGQSGEVITQEQVRLCHFPMTCLDDCNHGLGGGGVDDVIQDAGSPETTLPEDEPTDVYPLHLRYVGDVIGAHTMSAWWLNPDGTTRAWDVVMECADIDISDTLLECDLPVPSGSSNFEFQVTRPDGRFWGDHACDSGGCGNPLGSLTLTKGGDIPYMFQPNSAGPPYYNGYLASVP